MPDALQLLKTRRSIKPIELVGPPPSAAEIDTCFANAKTASFMHARMGELLGAGAFNLQWILGDSNRS